MLTVDSRVLGIPCLGLNGGPAFKHSEAFSFQVATADQAETDRYWNAIVGNGGEESAADGARTNGACPGRSRRSASDQSDQPIPTAAVAKRAFDAMMEMKKIDVAAIEAARRG